MGQWLTLRNQANSRLFQQREQQHQGRIANAHWQIHVAKSREKVHEAATKSKIYTWEGSEFGSR